MSWPFKSSIIDNSLHNTSFKNVNHPKCETKKLEIVNVKTEINKDA